MLLSCAPFVMFSVPSPRNPMTTCSPRFQRVCGVGGSWIISAGLLPMMFTVPEDPAL